MAPSISVATQEGRAEMPRRLAGVMERRVIGGVLVRAPWKRHIDARPGGLLRSKYLILEYGLVVGSLKVILRSEGKATPGSRKKAMAVFDNNPCFCVSLYQGRDKEQ